MPTRLMKILMALCWAMAAFVSSAGPVATFPVRVDVDAAHSVGSLPPIWRFFGADEPNYGTQPEGERLLLELGGLRPGQVYFRAHNLLITGDGTPDFKWGSTNIYTEQDQEPVYDFTIVDHIIDTYIARGVHPYLEIGFMPQAMTAAPADVPYRRPWQPGVDYKGITAGWSYPPRDYRAWGELVYQWTRHNVERYGRSEVAQWYFEVWNEPNLDFYWSGTAEEFYRLHDYAIDAVRRALPSARVGDAFTAWRLMGSPVSPAKRQIDTLIRAAQIHPESMPVVRRAHDDTLSLDSRLMPHSVQLIELADH